MKYDGWASIAVDYAQDPAWDLHTPGVVQIIIEEVVPATGRIHAGHVATECKSWSSARHGKPGSGCPMPLRDYRNNIWGFEGLSSKDELALKKGNQDACLSMDVVEDNLDDHVEPKRYAGMF